MRALVKRSPPARVILDRRWQGEGGWEFRKYLWADPCTMQIGVVLMHGRTGAPSLQADLLRAMPCQVVRTPFDRHELLRAIAAVLDPSPAKRARDDRTSAPISVAPFMVNAPVAALHAAETTARRIA